MAPIVSSHRSVRIVDAVSVYEPDSPKPTTYSMNEGSVVKGGGNHFVRSRNQNTGSPSGRAKKASQHLHGSEHRQSFFLNKLFRSGSTKTPYNSFRHTNSTSHDDRSHNDESTNPGSTGTGIQFMTSAPIDEYDTATDTEVTNDSNTQLTTIMMPPSPLLNTSSKVTIKPQQPPERRKFFMDKLFTVSRMHVSEAGITSLSPNQASHKHVNNNHRNARRSYKISSNVDPIVQSRITYSIDGDTTTTNSSVGVDEDVDEFSYQKSTVKSPKNIRGPAQSTIISTPIKHEPDFPTTTILMTTNQEIMEVQTDRFVDTPTKMETLKTPTTTSNSPSMRITVIPPTNQFNNNHNDKSPNNYSNSYNMIETFKTNVPSEANRSPVIQYIAPLQEKVTGSKPIPTVEQKSYSNGTRRTNAWGVTPSAPDTTGRHNQSRQSEKWPKSYYGTILDKVTKIQCITNCSDMELAKCDDTIEDYVTSPLNAVTRVWSRNNETKKAKTTHRSSANSILKQNDQSSASNSMDTDGDDEEDDLGTYDDSMISASLFDIETLDDEYTYSTFENEEDHGLHPHKNISNLPIHIQKSLLSDPSCNTSKYLGDDDGTSYSSQNSAWL